MRDDTSVVVVDVVPAPTACIMDRKVRRVLGKRAPWLCSLG